MTLKDLYKRFKPVAARVGRNLRDLPKGVATAVAAPFMSGEQLLKFNPKLLEENYPKRIAGTFFDVASLPVGGVQLKGTKLAGRALPKIIKAAGVRGAETAAFGAGRQASQGEPARNIARDLPRNFAFGAAGNTILSPRLTGKAIKEIPSAVRGTRAATQVAGRPGFAPGFAKVPGRDAPYQGEKDLTLKTLEKLKGRTSVSKQFISDLTNAPDLKQAERDTIRRVLAKEGNTVSVSKFAEGVRKELLPLEPKDYSNTSYPTGIGGYKYESVALPHGTRGDILDYKERIYQSPIETSGGGVHFDQEDFPGYFAHARVEDVANMPKGRTNIVDPNTGLPQGTKTDTRRVIEIQSDLFQKGRLENEFPFSNYDEAYKEAKVNRGYSDKDAKEQARRWMEETKGKGKLEPYRNTWHERLVKEEVRKAAQDGKKRLQFPTGETAMKIEGLGANADNWVSNGGRINNFDQLKVGQEVGRAGEQEAWIITDVLGDGKFKAVPRQRISDLEIKALEAGRTENLNFSRNEETFDISGKVDENNPIFKFYEKEVGRYLKNKYNAQLVTDAQGVTWWEIPVKKEFGVDPVEAYGAVAGVEPEYDEDGKLTGVGFDPAKAAAGLVAGGVIKRGGKYVPRSALVDKTGAKGTKLLVSKPEVPVSKPVSVAQADVLPRRESTGRALETPTAQLSGRSPIPEVSPQTRAVEPLETIIARTGGTDVKKKVNLLDYVRTPDRVLKKIGLENESKVIRRAYDNYVAELPEQIKKIDDWKSQVTPEGNIKIFKFLDGQIAKESLNPVEQKVATEVRSELENWADRLKLPKDKRITNYITHIFDEDLVRKEFPDEIANLISDKVAGSVYDPFTTQRLGKLGYKEDAFAALEAYVKRATRKVNLDPALEVIKKASEGLEQSQFKYVKQYIDRVNMRPTDIDNLIDNTIKSLVGYKAGVRPLATISRKARQVIYRGTLGLNVSSALKNLSQGANTYSRLGEKYTLKGYFDLFKNFKSDELVKVGVLKDDFIQDRVLSASKKGVQAMDKGLFSLFEFAEKVNRGAAYYGAKAKALAQGLDETEAIQAAKQVVRDTQFTFGSIDTPPILQSDIGKTFGQFQSFTLKQGEFLGEMLSKRDVAGLTRWTGASLLFVYGIGEMFGMEPKDLIPTVRIGVPPALQLPVDLAKVALGGKDKYGNDLKLMDVLKKDLVPLVPAGTQIKKSYEGLKAASQGYSESKGGRVRFPVSQSTGSKIQSGLFGQYTSDEARDYFENKQTPLGDKDSQKFKLLPPDQQRSLYEGVQLKRQAEKDKTKLRDQLQNSLKGKAQAADTDKWAVAYGFDKVEGSKTSQARKLIKEEAIPGNVKTELAKKLGIEKEVDTELAVMEFEKSSEKRKVINDVLHYRDSNGELHTAKFGAINPPKLTSDVALNKKLISSFQSSITSRQTKIAELYREGVLSEQEAAQAIQELEAMRKKSGKSGSDKGGGKKVRNKTKVKAAYSISKPSTAKFTFKSPKTPNVRVPKSLPSNIFRTERIGYQGGVRRPNTKISSPSRRPRIIGRPRKLV